MCRIIALNIYMLISVWTACNWVKFWFFSNQGIKSFVKSQKETILLVCKEETFCWSVCCWESLEADKLGLHSFFFINLMP